MVSCDHASCHRRRTYSLYLPSVETTFQRQKSRKPVNFSMVLLSVTPVRNYTYRKHGTGKIQIVSNLVVMPPPRMIASKCTAWWSTGYSCLSDDGSKTHGGFKVKNCIVYGFDVERLMEETSNKDNWKKTSRMVRVWCSEPTRIIREIYSPLYQSLLCIYGSTGMICSARRWRSMNVVMFWMYAGQRVAYHMASWQLTL